MNRTLYFTRLSELLDLDVPVDMRQHMRQQRLLRVHAAVGLAVGLAGVVDAGEEAPRVDGEVVSAEAVGVVDRDAKISAEAFEWVDISIHMPDGRVIHTKERRYPSRSRVYQLTGRLPMIKRDGAGSAGPGPDGAESLMTVIVDDGEGGAVGGGELIDSSGVEGLESLIDEVVVASDGDSNAGTTSGPVAVDDSGGGVVEQANGRAVRVFKKSS